jgi:hypothetical protein
MLIAPATSGGSKSYGEASARLIAASAADPGLRSHDQHTG